jgi:hypothetical protein
MIRLLDENGKGVRMEEHLYSTDLYKYLSNGDFIVKPSGRFWKRYFNKKVRNGLTHKRGNWMHWD